MRNTNTGVISKESSSMTKVYLLPPIVKLLLAVLLFFLICILGFSFFKGRAQSTLIALQQKRTQLENDVSAGARANGQMEYLSKNTDTAKLQYESMLKRFPSESQVGGLLANITKLGTKDGLKFISFKPKTAVDQKYYAEMPVDISLVGNFHQIARFLSGVANLPDSVVAVNKFTITRAENSDNLLSLEFTATVYYTLPTSMDFKV
ncbi:MAG TPA: type 4a pilus biogenesis protein PilO [Coxiellaceae bacterium]|nr:MAG: hypothetical protein A3E81_08440 [Gammaproteobacteria bacterium RIFCSPHIGHO2_12_FULL_36_30]HLB55755.1 type 4a pilus biogenesis protein PilO [Coxiellaceae bacterium]